MKTKTKKQLTAYEQVLINIVRKLPADRVSQVVDFARFIEWQAIGDHDLDLQDEETEEEIRASEEKWDQIFAKPEAQRLMIEMAYEALAEQDAGLTREMLFDEDGNLIEPL